jgi:hypothetical protein
MGSSEAARPAEAGLNAVLPQLIPHSRRPAADLGEVEFRRVASEHLVGADGNVLNYHLRESTFDTNRVDGDPTYRSLLERLRAFSPEFEPGFRRKMRYERITMPSVGNFRPDIPQNGLIHARHYLPGEDSGKPSVLIPSFGVRDWQHHFFSLYLASRDYPVLELVLPLNEERAPAEWKGANRTRRFMLLKPALADLEAYTAQYCLDMRTGLRFLKQEKCRDAADVAMLGLSFTATTVQSAAASERVGKRVLLLGGMSPPLDYVWEEDRAKEFRTFLEASGVSRDSMKAAMAKFIPASPGAGDTLLINALGDGTQPMEAFAEYWKWQNKPSAVLCDARGFPDAHIWGIYLSPDAVVSETEAFLSGKGEGQGTVRVYKNMRAGLGGYVPADFAPLKPIRTEEKKIRGAEYEVTHLA